MFIVCSDFNCIMFVFDVGFYDTCLFLDSSGCLFVYLVLITFCWICMSLMSKGYNDMITDFIVVYLLILSVVFFMSGDLIFLYIIFDLTTVPILMFVSFTGVSLRRAYALGVMVIYVLLSSALFGFILFMYMSDFGDFQSFYMTSVFNGYISDRFLFFLVLFIFFAVKIPMFPFISWLPEAHVESNTEISILLAAIVLKFAGFGFLRVHNLMDYDSMNSMSWFAIALCLMGVLYGCMSSLHHLDMKKLIAYSSIVHMNLGLSCMFVNDFIGINVFILGMLIHGIVSTGLFYTVGFASESIGSRHLQFLNTGIVSTPLLSFGALVIIFLNISVPLSVASIIEFLTLLLYESLGLMYLIIGGLCAIWYCCAFSFILLHRVYMRDSSTYNADIVDLGIFEIYILMVSMGIVFISVLFV